MAIFKLKARGRPDGTIKVFVSRIVQHGWVQRAFKEQIGDPVGDCVKGKVRKGMSAAEIQQAVKDCAPAKGIKLKRPGGRRRK